MKAASGRTAFPGEGSLISLAAALLSVSLAASSCGGTEGPLSGETPIQETRSVTGSPQVPKAVPESNELGTTSPDQQQAPAEPAGGTEAGAQEGQKLAAAAQTSKPDGAEQQVAKRLAKLEAIVAEMEPGVWRELEDTRIPLVSSGEHDRMIAQSGAPSFWGWTGSESVITAWNSSAYDPEGQQWYFFGGGHADYGGNEVYALDLVSLEWSRLTQPSPLTGDSYVEEGDSCPTPETGPPSVHTYGTLAWNPETRSVWLLGLDNPFCTQGDGKTPAAFWEFDPRTKEWRSHETERTPSLAVAAWNPAKRRFMVIETYGVGSRMEVDGQGKVHNYFESGDWWQDGNGAYDPIREVVYILQKEQIFSLTTGLREGRAFDLPLDLHSRNQSGLVYHPPSDRFLLWSGQRAVFAWDPKENTFQRYDNLEGTSGPKKGAERAVYGKIVHIASLDVFAAYNNPRQGVWIYRLPEEPGTTVEDKPRACVNDDCSFNSIRDAFAAAGDGAEITILPGRYQEAAILEANGVTIRAKGAHIYDAAVQGKAAFVIKGDNTVIEGLECSNIAVSSGNGACIRLEGKNLTLREIFSHHNQMGVLASSGTGLVRIEDSRFEDNGIPGGALGHNLYIESDELEFIRSKSLRASNEGHELKSRAGRTLIKDSVLASLDAEDSRVVDIPNGGKVTIQDSVIQQGPNTTNSDVIGIGLERGRGNGEDHTENRVVIRGNTILLDRNLPLDVLNLKDVKDLDFSGNRVVGGSPLGQGDNLWFFDRKAAGLPQYPSLPE